MATIHHRSMPQTITILRPIFEYFVLVFRIENANKMFQSMKEDFHTASISIRIISEIVE